MGALRPLGEIIVRLVVQVSRMSAYLAWEEILPVL